MKLYPGYYEVIVIGAGGGASRDANGHHSTNYGMGGTGGSGASFKGTIKITSEQTLVAKTGKGGGATSGGGTGGTGGASSFAGISCPGGGGAYSGGRHSNSPGAGAAKCSFTSTYVSQVTTNKGGNSGHSTYCKHTGCSTGVGGASPAIKVTNNYGGTCGATIAFKSSKSSVSSGIWTFVTEVILVFKSASTASSAATPSASRL